MTIILLEDDEAIAGGLGRIAKRLGHQLIHARSVAEATSAFHERPVDLLLADLGLDHGENGIDALLWAKAHAPATKRVLMSGAIDARTTANLGWDACLVKPFGTEEFSALLDSVAGAT